MRLLLKTTLLLFTGLTLLLLMVLAAISDDEPLAKPAAPVTPAVARQVKQLAKQMQFGLYYLQTHTMAFTEADISNLFAVAARALPRLSGDAHIGNGGSELRLTLYLPENPFGDYLNFRLGLPATAQGLVIDHLAIGSLTLHGASARALLEMAANLAFGGAEGTTLLASIQALRTIHNRLLVDYHPTPHLDEKLATALSRLQPWRDEITTAESAAIRHYYMQLCNSTSASDSSLSQPLSQPLSAIFRRAAERSRSASEAASENRAALLALAIHFGNERFNTVVNAIDNSTLKRCQGRAAAATLAGRRDLALHFLYAAVIKIIAGSQTSFAMGELKEMVDSLQGGSGFSFADLAADESGIRFAELATAPESARRLQQAAAALADEARFFPAIAGLPEAIPQQQFEERYGGTTGAYYNQQLGEIKRRIEALALYHPPP